MTDNKKAEMEQWFSTYGVLTAERILGRFNIRLDHQDLRHAVTNSRSLYYHLLRVPLKHVYTGIILQQAIDYQSFVQKLFVDYLISGQADKPADSSGQSTREHLEEERLILLGLNDDFLKAQTDHKTLIANSQAALIKHASKLEQSLDTACQFIKSQLSATQSMHEIKKAIHASLVRYDGPVEDIFSEGSPFWVSLSERLSIPLDASQQSNLADTFHTLFKVRNELDQDLAQYVEKCDEMMATIRSFRTQFYEMIIRVKALIANLPEYRLDEEKVDANLEAIQFDFRIGEE